VPVAKAAAAAAATAASACCSDGEAWGVIVGPERREDAHCTTAMGIRVALAIAAPASLEVETGAAMDIPC